MNKRPYDPNNEFKSDDDYSKAMDTIQNERYKEYIFWLKFRRFINRVALVFLILLVIWFVFFR